MEKVNKYSQCKWPSDKVPCAVYNLNSLTWQPWNETDVETYSAPSG